MTIDGFSVLDKAAKESFDSAFDDLGVKLQLQNQQHTQSFPFSNMMFVDHNDNNPYRPFPSSGFGDIGPTRIKNRRCFISSNDNIGGGHSDTDRGHCAVISSSVAGGMAASLGFPFTNAQWKELERQAMIYKYMMASVPVPPHLLIPTSRNFPLDPTVASHHLLGSGLNLKFTNGADLEPGRCKRTDGKKWRCSRDVAPDQKYCERHMHRGRPRSRKPVELLSNTNTTNNKKIRYTSAESASNNNNGVVSEFDDTLAQPYLQAPVFLDNPNCKVANFDTSVAFASSFKEPRSMNWVVKGPGDQQWQNTEIGLSSDSVLNPDYQEQALNLNPFGNFSRGEDQQSNNQSTLFFDDKFSHGVLNDPSANCRNRNSSVSSNGKLLNAALSLSIDGSISSMNEEMGQIQMGLGLIESDQIGECCTKPMALAPASWTEAATPGGPLAEVLQLSSVANQLSPVAEIENGDYCSTPQATAVYSPSGVVQKELPTSFSDSSNNSVYQHLQVL
ncbi:growth-regulating factor 7 isoform X2 [Jatropha curcas]|uniref:growth-regulating factor 7 isoform X2 n=1 Tax=Jatropha curcas TaxID=180498 RepID=UPI0009D75547|nr:growth-regulating factor 7 isoform X2 [Jatropha curcas]